MGIIIKRGKYYHMIYDGPPKPDGSRNQVFRSCKGMNKKEALAALREAEVKRDQGESILPARGDTVHEFLMAWLEQTRSLVKASTLANYEINVRVHLVPAFGGRKLKELKRGDVQKLITKLHDKGLATKTIANIVLTLHRAMGVAVLDGKLRANPCDKVELPKRTKPERKNASLEELTLIRAELQKPKYDAYRLGFLLAIAIGARRGEIAAIQWKHVNFETGTVTIRQAFSRVSDKEIHLQSTKNDFVNNIPLPSLMLIILRQANETTIFNRDDGFVCCDRDGKPHNPAHLTEAFNRLVINAGLYEMKKGQRKDYKRKGTERREVSYKVPKYTLHCMRHTQATLLIAAGVDIVTVASRLGHRRVSTTSDIYSHAVTEAQQKAAEVANDFLRE